MNNSPDRTPLTVSLRACVVAALLASGGIARSQETDFDPESLEEFAAADMGFVGMGEPSPPNQPYQPPPALPPATPDGSTVTGDPYGQWQQWKSNLKQRTGTSFELYLNPIDHVIVAGPNSGINRAAFWFNFHLEQTLWQGARLVSNTRGGTGKGMDRYVDSHFNINKNTNEADEIYISHLYLEQKLLSDKITLAAGKLDLLDSFDSNEVGSWNFIPYTLARNPTIAAPYHALGASVRWDATEWLYAQVGGADSGGEGTETGFNTAFRSGEAYFTIGEIGIKPKLLGRPGTYRFIVWNDTGNLDRFDGAGTESSDQGVAFNFDQQITDRLGIFARYGITDEAVHEVHQYWSVGGTYAGPIPSRRDDLLGFGVAQGLISDDFRATTSGASSSITQFDLYYKVQVRQWLSVTPDFQVILNPDDEADEDVAFIAGVNVEIRL
ncbi:MAG TPA: carbohydrate porin [Tepidisphaeraceae bacterium]